MKFKDHILGVAAAGMGLLTFVSAQAQDHPTATDQATQNPAVKSPNAISWGDLGKGHNSFTRAEAISRFEKAGYTHVSHLRLDGDGLWQANAMNHDRPVHVALDYKGNLAEQ